MKFVPVVLILILIVFRSNAEINCRKKSDRSFRKQTAFVHSLKNRNFEYFVCVEESEKWEVRTSWSRELRTGSGRGFPSQAADFWQEQPIFAASTRKVKSGHVKRSGVK
jgi:hypothetical protein